MESLIQTQQKNYLKLTIDNVQMLKHVKFQKDKRKESLIRLFVDVQYVDRIKEKKINLAPIELISVELNESLFFYPKSNRWDCIMLPDKLDSHQPQIRLNLAIFQNQKFKQKNSSKGLENFDSSTLKSNNVTNLQTHKSISLSEEHESFLQKQPMRKFCLPTQTRQIIIPLEKFLRYKNKIHEVTLDFSIPNSNQQEIATIEQTLSEQSKQKSNKKQKNEKDGVLSFSLVFLSQLITQLTLRNLRLSTECFAKQHKLYVYQVFHDFSEDGKKKAWLLSNNRQEVYRNQSAEQVLKQKKISTGTLMIPLPVKAWHLYQNEQSLQEAIILPLTLKNNLDEIEFLLEFQMEKGSKKEDSKEMITLSKSVFVDDLYKASLQKQNKAFEMMLGFESVRFELRFDFEVRLERGPKTDSFFGKEENSEEQLVVEGKIS